MTKLIFATFMGIVALAFMAGTGIAQAAPPTRVSCQGTASVWDDTDIVHVTVPKLDGESKTTWHARGHTTLNCGTGSPLTGKVAQIDQVVEARFVGQNAIQGQGVTNVTVAGMSQSFRGRFSGSVTISGGTLAVSGDYDSDGAVDGQDFLSGKLHTRQHGVIDLVTKQATGFYIDDFVIGAK